MTHEASALEANEKLDDAVQGLLAQGALKLARLEAGRADLADVLPQLGDVTKLSRHVLLEHALDQVLFIVQESAFAGHHRGSQWLLRHRTQRTFGEILSLLIDVDFVSFLFDNFASLGDAPSVVSHFDE